MSHQSPKKTEYEVSNKIFTAANVITFIRLILVPVFIILLMDGHDFAAGILFAVTAATDFLDGQVARRTNTVTRLGQLLDPAVDVILMITGFGSVMVIGRLPIWIGVVVLARELYVLLGGAYLLKRYNARVPVIYLGKIATTFMFFGVFGLLINMPLVPGMGICDISWLPGFNAQPCSWGIWSIYIGLCLDVVTTVYYSVKAYKVIKVAREKQGADQEPPGPPRTQN